MYWNPDPIAFTVGPLSISWYGLTWSLSIITGYFLFKYFYAIEGKPANKLVPLVQYIFFGCLIGARVFDVFYYNFSDFLADPLFLFKVWEGGLASHGALIGSMLFVYVFSRLNKEFSYIWLIDRMAICGPLLGGYIRIGNFINGELYGTPTDLPWGVIFGATDYDLIPRHPVQLYEALWLFTCFILMIYLYKNRERWFPGFLAAVFMISAFLGRIFLEFFKEAEVLGLWFSQTQWVSVGVVLAGISFYIYSKRKHESSSTS